MNKIKSLNYCRDEAEKAEVVTRRDDGEPRWGRKTRLTRLAKDCFEVGATRFVNDDLIFEEVDVDFLSTFVVVALSCSLLLIFTAEAIFKSDVIPTLLYDFRRRDEVAFDLTSVSFS